MNSLLSIRRCCSNECWTETQQEEGFVMMSSPPPPPVPSTLSAAAVCVPMGSAVVMVFNWV
ncbi:hypothetical protein SESBI_47563 [Sesbania bispinosa]|nr:hypothetical protein SESBI_47563 [Sesbania bispinosa]